MSLQNRDDEICKLKELVNDLLPSSSSSSDWDWCECFWLSPVVTPSLPSCHATQQEGPVVNKVNLFFFRLQRDLNNKVGLVVVSLSIVTLHSTLSIQSSTTILLLFFIHNIIHIIRIRSFIQIMCVMNLYVPWLTRDWTKIQKFKIVRWVSYFLRARSLTLSS